MRYPHWVNYIRSLLDAQYDPQTIYTSGFTVYTTLDPGLQDMAQQIVTSQIKTLSNLHVTDGLWLRSNHRPVKFWRWWGRQTSIMPAIAGQLIWQSALGSRVLPLSPSPMSNWHLKRVGHPRP